MTQRFGGINPRGPDVASAITHQRLIVRFGIAGTVCGYALVVNPHFLSRLDVVVENHLAAAGNHCAADFYGSEPVEMKVRNEIVRKAQHQVSDILDALLDVAT